MEITVIIQITNRQGNKAATPTKLYYTQEENKVNVTKAKYISITGVNIQFYFLQTGKITMSSTKRRLLKIG
jgi:hypothetical protein